MNRGDRREVIFLDDVDRRCFLQTLSEASEKTRWQVHAYCLMKYHFHLVMETPQPNILRAEAADNGQWSFSDASEYTKSTTSS
jgi:putative transposase